jgi:predicted metal-dependent phosphoesterase TrpH
LAYDESGDGEELRRLLQVVSDKGLQVLTIAELDRLRALLEAKDYRDNKKADKSKRKLLKQINSAMYDRHRPRRIL